MLSKKQKILNLNFFRLRNTCNIVFTRNIIIQLNIINLDLGLDWDERER